jgi:hypothetical protein
MASVRFADLQARPTEFLDLTSLTLDELQQLVPPFEAAFQAPMAAWRREGKPPDRPPSNGLPGHPHRGAQRAVRVCARRVLRQPCLQCLADDPGQRGHAGAGADYCHDRALSLGRLGV